MAMGSSIAERFRLYDVLLIIRLILGIALSA